MRVNQCGWLLGAVVGLALTASQASANLLANSSFEDPVTSNGAPFVGSWEAFTIGAGASSVNSTLMPRTGAQHLNASINGLDNAFTGVFQDVEGLVPGQTGVFSAWHKTTTNPLDLVVEMRIEWRKVGQAAEVSRTANFLPVPTSDYTKFSLSAAVPAGADTARVVYALQTFGGGPTNNGIVFVDDVSFVVPEPATLGLFGATLISLIGMRRKRGA